MTNRFSGFLCVVAVASLVLGCGKQPAPEPEPNQQQTVPKEAARQPDQELLQGAWTVVSIVSNGENEPPEKVARVSVVFRGDQMIIREPHHTDEHERFKLDSTKSPKTIDLTDEDDESKVRVLAIYELNGDDLKICGARQRGARPSTFESKTGTETVLFVLKRNTSVPVEKEPDVSGYPKAIVGKWKATSTITELGFFFVPTEFTADGRMLQLDEKANMWAEKYKYRFDKGTLVLILPKKDSFGRSELRIKIKSISDDQLIARSPSATLKRLK